MLDSRESREAPYSYLDDRRFLRSTVCKEVSARFFCLLAHLWPTWSSNRSPDTHRRPPLQGTHRPVAIYSKQLELAKLFM